MFKLKEIVPVDIQDSAIPGEVTVDTWFAAQLCYFMRPVACRRDFRNYAVEAHTPYRGTIVADLGEGLFVDVAEVSVMSDGKTLTDLGLPLISREPVAAAPVEQDVTDQWVAGAVHDLNDPHVDVVDGSAAKKFKVVQHTPGWVDDGRGVLAEAVVDSWEEMKQVDWIAPRISRPDVVKVSISPNVRGASLMVDMAGGDYWVIAHISLNSPTANIAELDLPIWVRPTSPEPAVEEPQPTPQPVASYHFVEGASAGTPPSMLVKFDFTTREELVNHPFIRNWADKPDFLKFDLGEVNRDEFGEVESVQLLSIVRVDLDDRITTGRWVIGVIYAPDSDDVMQALKDLGLGNGTLHDLNDLPGVSVVVDKPAPTPEPRTKSVGRSQEIEDLFDASVSGGMTVLAAFHDVLLNHVHLDYPEDREAVSDLLVHIGTNYFDPEFLEGGVDENIGTLRWDVPNTTSNNAADDYVLVSFVERAWAEEEKPITFGNTAYAERFLSANPERFGAFCRQFGWDVKVIGHVAVVNTYGLAGVVTVVDGVWALVGNVVAPVIQLFADEEFVKSFQTLESAIDLHGGSEARKIVTVELDPLDKDPVGTIAFLLKEAGIEVPERPEEPIEEDEEPENLDVDNDTKRDLLLQFQNTLISPEAGWDDLLEALHNCKRNGCDTPGQLIEADGSDILDEALRQEEEGSASGARGDSNAIMMSHSGVGDNVVGNKIDVSPIQKE